MILSGKEIWRGVKFGGIKIDPFDETRLNSNSYNVRLNDKLLVYENNKMLDIRKKEPVEEILMPPDGFPLFPGILYLGSTVEYTESTKYVPMLEGRSSIGRFGIHIHVTAGFGDVGFKGYWTFEIHVVQPVIIYPFIEIAQLYYHTIQGEYECYGEGSQRNGKYNGNTGVQASMLYKEFEGGKK